MSLASEVLDLRKSTLATERLLNVLIALLSARDPDLLRDLQAVFATPDFAADEAGSAAADMWRRILHELDATGRLVEGLGENRKN